MAEPLDVTVIGGYLGAGKTTLVNHVLATTTERIVVLVNDFGEVDIDAELIESRTDDTITLTNGCICCTLVDGFASALDRVATMTPRPDRLVIETSGVADPAQVAAFGHGPGLRLDATVVVVDGERLPDLVEDPLVGQTVDAQLRAASIVVLNKEDLWTDPDAPIDWVRERFEPALILRARHARVPCELLFGAANAEPTTPTADPIDASAHFQSWSHVTPRPIPRQRLAALVDALPAGVTRAKGIVHLEETPDLAQSFQLVGRRWSLTPLAGAPPSVGCRIVVIGPRGALGPGWLDGQLAPDP